MPCSSSLAGLSETRLFPRAAGFIPRSQERAERAQVEVQIAVLEPELDLELLHPLCELHERLTQALDLLVGERPSLHPPERLALHQLPQQLDERQDELREAALDPLRIGLDPPRQGVLHAVELGDEPVQIALRCEDAIGLVAARQDAAPPALAAKL